MKEVVRVEEVASTELHDLRRRVLRNNDPASSVIDQRDEDPESLHFAIRSDETVVACGSLFPSASPLGDDAKTYQLRYLATEEVLQGHGFGSLLLRAAEDRLSSLGVDLVWANARDTALDFYRKTGWVEIPGSEHLSPETALPHTKIFKPLLTTQEVSIELATEEDAPALVQLRRAMMYAIDLADHDGEWRMHALRYFEDNFRRGQIIAVVARADDGAIVSSAVAELRFNPPSPWNPRGASAYVHTVSTRPNFRRQGISLRLMNRLIEELRERHITVVDLHATAQGAPLYRSLGFTPREPANEMRLRLSDD